MKIRKSSFFLYSMQIRSYFFIIWLTINNFQKKVDKLKFTNILKVLSFFLMNKIHCWKWKIQKTIGRCFKRPIIIICLQKIVKKFRKRDHGRGSLYTCKWRTPVVEADNKFDGVTMQSLRADNDGAFKHERRWIAMHHRPLYVTSGR